MGKQTPPPAPVQTGDGPLLLDLLGSPVMPRARTLSQSKIESNDSVALRAEIVSVLVTLSLSGTTSLSFSVLWCINVSLASHSTFWRLLIVVRREQNDNAQVCTFGVYASIHISTQCRQWRRSTVSASMSRTHSQHALRWYVTTCLLSEDRISSSFQLEAQVLILC